MYRDSSKPESFTCKKRHIFTDWIPAYAGMTGKRKHDRKTQA